ncbi:MAG: ABC transporter ATP-binding protein [Methanobacteriota archaeon]
MLRIENLRKSFEGKTVLEDINLEIKKGEIFAVLGPSGAGKTTLLRVLNLLEKPSNGRVLFYLSGSEKEKLALRRKMAMVFQEAPLFNRSVYENVAYSLEVRKEKQEAIKEKVKRILLLVGLSGYESRNAATLSGGEKQRVAFAMATIFEPELLFLDEPTANLDPVNEGIIEELIVRINRLGITIVLATHKQAEVLALASRIAVLNRGRIEQTGSPEEIFYKPKTRFVAEFVGTKNIFEGEVKSKHGNKMLVAAKNFDLEVPGNSFNAGEQVYVCIRPEEIMVLREDVPAKTAHRNVLSGKITQIISRGGAMLRLYVQVREEYLVVDIPRHAAKVMNLKVGKEVKLSLKFGSCHVIYRTIPRT